VLVKNAGREIDLSILFPVLTVERPMRTPFDKRT
jgi:hypothetical protein